MSIPCVLEVSTPTPAVLISCERLSEGPFAVEWETGNVSSSHRSLNKLSLGIIQEEIVGGALLVPKARVDEMWEDIPPVRHARYKHRDANALAPILLERVICMSTNKGDMVLDPFGGTGTTFYAAERHGRKWEGTELGDTEPAIERMEDLKAGKVANWESGRGKSQGPVVKPKTKKTRGSPSQLALINEQ